MTDRVRLIRTGRIFDVHSRTDTHVYCYMGDPFGMAVLRGIPIMNVKPVETYWCNVYRRRDGTTCIGDHQSSREGSVRTMAESIGFKLNSRIKVTLK